MIQQRLQTLLSKENLASSRFADIIGVNRSSISHLLSGRNNPNYDFLQKVLLKFPNLNSDWLLLGKGEMYRDAISDTPGAGSRQSELFNIAKDDTPSITEENKPIAKSFKDIKIKKRAIEGVKDPEAILDAKDAENTKKMSSSELIKGNESPSSIENNKVDKELVKIVFFYNDNSFESFHPNS